MSVRFRREYLISHHKKTSAITKGFHTGFVNKTDGVSIRLFHFQWPSRSTLGSSHWNLHLRSCGGPSRISFLSCHIAYPLLRLCHCRDGSRLRPHVDFQSSVLDFVCTGHCRESFLWLCVFRLLERTFLEASAASSSGEKGGLIEVSLTIYGWSQAQSRGTEFGLRYWEVGTSFAYCQLLIQAIAIWRLSGASPKSRWHNGLFPSPSIWFWREIRLQNSFSVEGPTKILSGQSPKGPPRLQSSTHFFSFVPSTGSSNKSGHSPNVSVRPVALPKLLSNVQSFKLGKRRIAFLPSLPIPWSSAGAFIRILSGRGKSRASDTNTGLFSYLVKVRPLSVL